MEIKPQDSTEKNLQTLRSPGILGIVAISKETVWNNPNVVIVPAYEENSEVRILPKPAFLRSTMV